MNRNTVRWRAAFATALIFCGMGLMLIYPGSGSSHEPITTKVRFNKEIVRVLEQNCMGCHSPGRIKADIPLTTYDEARPWAKAIKEEVLEKRMMPFQAVKGYGQFSHDFTLPQREIDLLISWIEGGAPRGDIKDYPEQLKQQLMQQEAGEPVWTSGKPDLVIQPATPLKIGAEGENETKCISIPAPIDNDKSVKGFEFQPGNGTVVKSAEFFISESGVRSKGTCPQNGESGVELLGNWVPGQPGITLPGDATFHLAKGSGIILRITYQKTGEEAVDQSRLALYFKKDNGGKGVRSLSIKPSPFTVPANTGNHRVRMTYTIDQATEALAIRPLIFPYAKSLAATAILPDGGVEVLIWVKNYRFDWQPTYYYRKPVALPRGTKIVLTAYLDNSESNRNLPTDPAVPLNFDQPLCSLTLTESASPKQAKLE